MLAVRTAAGQIWYLMRARELRLWVVLLLVVVVMVGRLSVGAAIPLEKRKIIGP